MIKLSPMTNIYSYILRIEIYTLYIFILFRGMKLSARVTSIHNILQNNQT